MKIEMHFRIKDLGKLFKTTFNSWMDIDPFRESAVIAYYAIFSIPALLILVIAIASSFFEKDAVDQNILNQISSTMGADIAAQIKVILTNAAQAQSSLWGSVVGLVILLTGATGVFVELQKTFNKIWEVIAVPQKGIWIFLKARLFSFGLILGVAFLLLISLVVSTVIAAISSWIKVDASGFMVVVLGVVNFIFSLVVISFLFALMFKILPDAKIRWEHVWLGGLITGLLFTIGKSGLAFYFGKAHPASAYGAAGSIILILLWVSYSSMIMFFGAEFTAAFAKKYSGKIAPSEIARRDNS
jgi:membrane protein